MRLAARLRLRQRLMLWVTLLLAAILVAASVLVIVNARRAIADEMRSSVNLASDLIEASLAGGAATLSGARQLDRIGHFRHLCLALIGGDEKPPPCPGGNTGSAPRWFAALTRPQALPERSISVAADRRIRILADPEDEIDEAWHDSRGLLALLLVFYAAILITLYALLGRALVPVRRIDAGLQRIEQGDYDTRLPSFSLPEFDGIAGHFNHMAAALAAARAENHRLREQSLRIQEDERGNLARELHDELGQSLTAIRADAAGILAQRQALPATVVDAAAAIAEVAARIYDQARSMMRRLRPPGLDELGLAAALEEHIAGWRRARPDVAFSFTERGALDAVPPFAAIHVFRIVQEALTNALRHARAERIAVTLHARAGRVHLHVCDDGRGFDVGRRPRGLGLSGMQERMELLGGRLRVSANRRGTAIHARLSLPGANEQPPRESRPIGKISY